MSIIIGNNVNVSFIKISYVTGMHHTENRPCYFEKKLPKVSYVLCNISYAI